MPIRFSSDAPVDALERIGADVVARRESKGGVELESFMRSPRLAASDGVQCWSLSLDDAERGRLEGAQPRAWRYLVFQNDQLVSEAHLHTEADARPVSATVRGPAARRIVRAFEIADGLSQVRTTSFEPRLLQVPSLSFTALWLHAPGADELFIPLPPVFLPLPVDGAVGPAALRNFLQTEGKRVRTMIEASSEATGGAGGPGVEEDASASSAAPPSFLRVRPIDVEVVQGWRKARGLDAPSIDLEAFTGPRSKQLRNFMEEQERNYWCWAAVATSVGNLLKTKKPGKWTQCDTASRCLPGVDCCANPSACNAYGSLEKALERTLCLDFPEREPATRKRIQRMLGKDLPICVRIEWFGSGAHFVAITGYELLADGRMQITVQDPQVANSPIDIDLEDFPRRYRGEGTWKDTYYCKR